MKSWNHNLTNWLITVHERRNDTYLSSFTIDGRCLKEAAEDSITPPPISISFKLKKYKTVHAEAFSSFLQIMEKAEKKQWNNDPLFSFLQMKEPYCYVKHLLQSALPQICCLHAYMHIISPCTYIFFSIYDDILALQLNEIIHCLTRMVS